MVQLREEILAFTRACERLLSNELTLSDDERQLVEYYADNLSREFSSHSSPAQQTGGSADEQGLPL